MPPWGVVVSPDIELGGPGHHVDVRCGGELALRGRLWGVQVQPEPLGPRRCFITRVAHGNSQPSRCALQGGGHGGAACLKSGSALGPMLVSCVLPGYSGSLLGSEGRQRMLDLPGE